MQLTKLRRHEVGLAAHVAEAVRSRDRKLARVIEPRIVERAFPLHLEHGDECIPMGDRAPAGVGMEVHAREAERRRDQRRGAAPVRLERLAIEQQLRVELAGPPTLEHVAHGRFVDAEQLRERRDARRERHDGADVQVAVRPAVAPSADAGRERVVDGAVAKSARDTDGVEVAGAIHETAHADDGIELEQRERHGGIVEIHASRLQHGNERRRQGRHIDLEPEPERGFRAQARADAAVRGACDRLVQTQRTAPEFLVAERVEAKRVAAARELLA